jgi:predicted methyltransferase
MSPMTRMTRGMIVSAAVLVAALHVGTASAADVYDAAVQNPARSADDHERDKLDHPADILRLTGIKPGMRVVDLLAGDGYYSELLSYVVGPGGHVMMLNNASFDRWSDGAWQARIAKNRLPNVAHETIDLNQMSLGAGTLDAVVLSKVYHDLYWVDADTRNWPKIDVSNTLDQVVRALKPGGVLLIVDHSAKAGVGSGDASRLHRIDEAFARHDFESRGLELVGRSDLLRKPEDARDQISYEPPMLGKTDRFVLVFRKRAGQETGASLLRKLARPPRARSGIPRRKNAQLEIYKGGSHGICSTEKDRVNADLLAFFKE